MHKVAIVGAGPRGLSALENLVQALSKINPDNSLHIYIFDGSGIMGSGPVYDPSQADTNWLNINERALNIEARQECILLGKRIPTFPSYHEWANVSETSAQVSTIDEYPPRSKLGRYLTLRFATLAKSLQNLSLLTVVREDIDKITQSEGVFSLSSAGSKSYFANEVALTIGHQPTQHDEQLSDWLTSINKSSVASCLAHPYPVNNILKLPISSQVDVVAVRGFGLAMIDVMRALTIGNGGHFSIIDSKNHKMRYHPSGKEPRKIIPFSLNGLPMIPKPLSTGLNAPLVPNKQALQALESELFDIAKDGDQSNTDFLIERIAKIAAEIFSTIKAASSSGFEHQPDLADTIAKWIKYDDCSHPEIISTDLPATQQLQAYVDMATGERAASLDYCVGHVWRHCQPSLYKTLSFSNFEPSVVANIIELDEKMKRYAYGPPVDSLQQMIALIDAGQLSLEFVNNPEISFDKQGWTLTNGHRTIKTRFMLNSVLNPPKVLQVNSSIIRNMLNDSLLKPIHDELAIDTLKNGRVVLSSGDEAIPIAVLGRLAKGTLMGVDAILECFNERATFWAEDVVNRLCNDAEVNTMHEDVHE